MLVITSKSSPINYWGCPIFTSRFQRGRLRCKVVPPVVKQPVRLGGLPVAGNMIFLIEITDHISYVTCIIYIYISIISTNIELIFHDIPIESPVAHDFSPPRGARTSTASFGGA